MPTAADIRQKIPEFADLDDQQLVDAVHQTYYPKLGRDVVANQLGVKAPEAPEAPTSLLRRGGDLAVSALKGAVDVPEAAVGLADIPTGGHIGKFLANEDGYTGFRPAAAKAFLDTFYSDAQKKEFDEVNKAHGLGDTVAAVVRNPSVAVQSAVESAPGMLAGGAVSRGALALAPRMAPELAGAIGEGVTAGGQQTEQTREETPDGLLTAEQAALTGGSGAADTAISLMGGRLARRLGIHDVQTLLTGAADHGARQSLVKSVLKGAAQEGLLEELPQSVQEQVAQNAALGKDLDDGVNQAAVLGAITGGAMGAGANVMGHAKKPAAPVAPPVDVPPAAVPPVPGAPLDMTGAPWTPPAAGGPELAPAAAPGGLDFEADPRFENAPVTRSGDEAPAGVTYGSKTAADIAIGEQGLMGSHAAAEVAPGQWAIQSTAAPGVTMTKPGVYQLPGDALRATAPPVSGPTSRAAAVAVEGQAAAVDRDPSLAEPVRPPAPPAVSDVTAAALLDHANARSAQLDEIEKGVPETVIPAATEDGEDTVIPATDGRHLTPDEKAEREFLDEHGGDATALAGAHGITPELDSLVQQRAAARAATTAATPEQLAAVQSPLDVRSTDIQTAAGAPFKIRGAANTALARHPNPASVAVTAVHGGFVLRPTAAGVQIPGDAPTVRAPDGSQRATFDTQKAAADYLKTARRQQGGEAPTKVRPLQMSDGRWVLATPAEHASFGSQAPVVGATSSEQEVPATAPAAPAVLAEGTSHDEEVQDQGRRQEEVKPPAGVPVEAPATQKLPTELSGAKPRYAFGSKQFTLQFASDVDRAAYIAAQQKPSKADAKYVQWAQQAAGMSAAEVRAHGAQVRAAIKEMARVQDKPGVLHVPDQRAEPEEPDYRARQGSGGTLSLEEAQRTVAKLTGGWSGLSTIHVVARQEDIPGFTPSPDSGTSGLFNNTTGDIYVVANQAHSAADIVETVVHEALGHLGLRAAFGGKLVPMLDSLATARPDLMRAKAEQYGLDLSNLAQRREAADEVLAEMAEKQPTQGWVARAVAAVRQWLRSAGIPVQLSDADIRGWLASASRAVRTGASDANLRNVDQFSSAERGASPQRFKIADLTRPAVDAVRAVSLPAGRQVGDFMGDTPGKLSVWDKTVGTPYHLAQRYPAFRKVFDGIQNFLNDVSYFAATASDLAPRMLPKLESWRDLGKSAISVADREAISPAVFSDEDWTRDAGGQVRRLTETEQSARRAHDAARQAVETRNASRAAQFQNFTTADKSAHLVKTGAVSPDVVHMWEGHDAARHAQMVDSAFKRATTEAVPAPPAGLQRPGTVFTDAELRQHFGITEGQVALYHEFRGAVDRSLDQVASAQIVRQAGADITGDVRAAAMAAPSAAAAAGIVKAHLDSLATAEPRRAAGLQAAAEASQKIADHIEDLKARGYAPRSRFGTFALDVVDPKTGNREYFELYETAADQRRAERQLKAGGQFDGMTFSRGTTSQEKYKIFAQMSPDTAELFGDMIGLSATGVDAGDMAFQEFLRRAKSNTSAMKRLVHRTGVEGFSRDVGRVLAGFVYSNARLTANSLHSSTITKAVNDIPQGQGQLTDQAYKLMNYVQNPQEEAAGLRGMLFAQYLGGSIASAMVNATQPFVTTLPYLSQYGGLQVAGRHLRDALKPAGNGGSTGDAGLDAAMDKYSEFVAPQEVHQLMGQAGGRATLHSSDGTRAGNAAAATHNAMAKIGLAWGKVFGVAESFNRRLTFIAAYRLAAERGDADPGAFAAQAVASTQFINNKGNTNAVSRNVVGKVLMTFKNYSISYLEMVHRMATAGEAGSPERAAGRRSALYAIGSLMVMAGADGLPFIEDIDDVIDAAMQRLGYNFATKRARQNFLRSTFGDDLGAVLQKGVSGLPGAPLDISGRLGMANLVPGTGLLVDKSDHSSDLMELAGPAGDLAKRGFQAAGQLAGGDVGGAAKTIIPRAAANAVQAASMWQHGAYLDASGKKVIDTDFLDGLSKAIGFQPKDVVDAQSNDYDVQRLVTQNALKKTQVSHALAVAEFNGDADAIAAARADLKDWNEKNSDTPIDVKRSAIRKALRQMNMTKEQRLAAGAPKEMRATVRRQLADTP